MVLLVEQERIIASEADLTTQTGQYWLAGMPCDWATIATENITLTEKSLIRIYAYFGIGGSGNYGSNRIIVDSVPVWCRGGINNGGWGEANPELYVVLAAGAHLIEFQGSIFTASSPWNGVQYISIKKFKFNDLETASASGRLYSSSSGDGATIVDYDLEVPEGRKLPVGAVKQYTAFIHIVAYDDHSTSKERRTRMKNIGEANDANKHCVRLFLDDAQVSWVNRKNDDATGVAGNLSYARGSYGSYCLAVDADSTLNIKVKDYSSSNRYCQVYVLAVLCPWITPTVAYQPVAFDFPQGSTFYAILEPFYENIQTKYSKLGTPRAISFGDATDYWSTESGTGLLLHSYTFDVVDVASCEWWVSCAAYVCISYVGVDVR